MEWGRTVLSRDVLLTAVAMGDRLCISHHRVSVVFDMQRFSALDSEV